MWFATDHGIITIRVDDCQHSEATPPLPRFPCAQKEGSSRCYSCPLFATDKIELCVRTVCSPQKRSNINALRAYQRQKRTHERSFLRHPPISTIEYTTSVFVLVGVFTVRTVHLKKKCSNINGLKGEHKGEQWGEHRVNTSLNAGKNGCFLPVYGNFRPQRYTNIQWRVLHICVCFY